MNRYCLLMLLVLTVTVSGFTFKGGDEDYLYEVKLHPGNIDPDKIFLLVDKSDYRDVLIRGCYLEENLQSSIW